MGDPNHPDVDESERTPRWVKIFAILAGIVFLAVVIIHLTGGGFHGHAIQ